MGLAGTLASSSFSVAGLAVHNHRLADIFSWASFGIGIATAMISGIYEIRPGYKAITAIRRLGVSSKVVEKISRFFYLGIGLIATSLAASTSVGIADPLVRTGPNKARRRNSSQSAVNTAAANIDANTVHSLKPFVTQQPKSAGQLVAGLPWQTAPANGSSTANQLATDNEDYFGVVPA
jgi:hypothetical protein